MDKDEAYDSGDKTSMAVCKDRDFWVQKWIDSLDHENTSSP